MYYRLSLSVAIGLVSVLGIAAIGLVAVLKEGDQTHLITTLATSASCQRQPRRLTSTAGIAAVLVGLLKLDDMQGTVETKLGEIALATKRAAPQYPLQREAR